MRFAFALVFALALGWVKCEEEKQLKFVDIFETCKAPFVTQDYNPNWMAELGVNENTTLYAPLISKGDIIRLTQQFYGVHEFEDIRESHLVNSCFNFKKFPGGFTMLGYNDKKFNKVILPVATMPNTFVFPSPTFNSVGGRIFVSLSDKKTYEVLTLCHDDGLGSFAVLTTEPTLSEGAMDTIKTHLRALGFKEDNFLEFDNTRDCSATNEDVPKPAKTAPILIYSPFSVPHNGLNRLVYKK